MMCCFGYTNTRRGSALVAVIIFGVIVSICAGFAYRATMFQTRMAARSGDYLAALAVAEAGAELALVELNKDSAATPKAFTGWSGSTNRKLSHLVADDEGRTVGETVVEVWDLDGEPKVLATGYVPNKATAKVRRSVQLSAKVDTVPSPFGGFGIYAFDDITIGGSAELIGNTGSGGDISLGGSSQIVGNAQAAGTISFKGNSKVTKKAESKSKPTPPPSIPSPTFSTARPTTNNNSQVVLLDSTGKRITVPSSGKKDVHANGTNDMTMPAPGVYHFDSLKLSGSSDLKITGNGEVTIYVENSFDMAGSGAIRADEGVTLNIISNDQIYMRGSKNALVQGKNNNVNIVTKKMDMGGSAEIDFSGNPTVTIWVTDSFSMRGTSDINASGKAASLIVYAESAVDFDMRGTPSVRGVLYAPNAKLDMSGTADWYGAVLVKTIEVGGDGKIHADESLLEPVGGSGAYVTAWVERAPVDL